MAKALFEENGRIGRIIFNRPEVLNAIDDDLPYELERGQDDRRFQLQQLTTSVWFFRFR